MQTRSLAVLAFFIAFVRFHTFDQPYGRDATTYAVIGHELLRGKQLYSQIWDHKPPAIYWTYAIAERIAGYGQTSIYLIGVIAAIGTLLCVYFAGRNLVRGANNKYAQAGGLLAAGIWAITSGDLAMAGFEPNTEAFINLLVAAGFALWISTDWQNKHMRSAWMIGACFAAASLYKPVCLFVLAPLSLAHVLIPPTAVSKEEWRPKALVNVLIFWISTGALWLCVFLYFMVTGARKDFIGAVFTYNRFYAGNIWVNLGRAIESNVLFHPSLQFCLPVILICLVAITFGMRTSNRRQWTYLLCYLAGTVVAVIAPGQFFEHYYQLLLPPLAIGAGWAVQLLEAFGDRGLRRLVPLTMCGVLAWLLYHEFPQYNGRGADWESRYFSEEFRESKNLGERLKTLLAPGESFYEWGSETGLYFYSGKSPVTKVLFHKHMVDGPFCQRFEQQTIDDLAKAKPKLLVLDTDYLVPGWQNDPVLKWCMERYRQLPEDEAAYKHFRLYTLAR